MNRKPLLLGIGAGLVSALLFASVSTGTLLGLFVLFFLSPMPVAIAGLGWGWPASAAAAGIGTLVVAVVGTGRAALFYALALGLPTAVLSYLLLLSRPAAVSRPDQDQEQASLEWYPIGRAVAWAALWAGVLGAMALLTTGTDIAGLRAVLRAAFERMLQTGAGLPPGLNRSLQPSELDSIAELMVLSFAGAIATLWMAVALLNFWGAGHVTRVSGQLTRPWPDLAAITLPRVATIGFAAAMALTFVPGIFGLAASAFASALLFAHMLVGLAIVHYVSRGSAMRPLLLTALYAALVLLSPFSGLLVALAGLAEPFSPWRRRWPAAPTT